MSATDFPELPEIQESEIEELSTSANFKKGRALFDDEKLGELRVEGDLISAICTEKSDDVAVPQAQFNSSVITSTACTCSHSGGGVCRHRVALLLYLAHTPEKFERIEVSNEPIIEAVAKKSAAPPRKKAEAALFDDLSKRDSSELASMILALVESEPKLKGALRRLMQPRLSEGEVKKVQSTVESQIKKVLKSYDPNFSLVRREIKLQLRSAQSLEANRPLDAGRLFVAILEGLLSGGDEAFYEDQGNVFSGAARECLIAINRVFDGATSDRRLQWLAAVCSAYLIEIESEASADFEGGCETILLKASPDEWETIEKRLDNFLEARSNRRRKTTIWSFAGAQDVEYTEDTSWGREKIVGLKTKWMALNGKADLAREIVMKQGSSSQQVDILLMEKEFDLAVEIATKHFDGYWGLIHKLANDLFEAGEWERAKAWAIHHQMNGWLADKSVERGESDALEYLVRFFAQQSDFTSWSRALDYAKPEERESIRKRMWQLLEERGAYLAQFDIATRLHEADEVMRLWPKLNEIQKMGRQVEYALAIEGKYPLISLKIWNAIAERLIGFRSREDYRSAAKALLKSKKILSEAGRAAEFEAQLASLKSRYSMLRALQEEIARVGL